MSATKPRTDTIGRRVCGQPAAWVRCELLRVDAGANYVRMELVANEAVGLREYLATGRELSSRDRSARRWREAGRDPRRQTRTSVRHTAAPARTPSVPCASRTNACEASPTLPKPRRTRSSPWRQAIYTLAGRPPRITPRRICGGPSRQSRPRREPSRTLRRVPSRKLRKHSRQRVWRATSRIKLNIAALATPADPHSTRK